MQYCICSRMLFLKTELQHYIKFFPTKDTTKKSVDVYKLATQVNLIRKKTW